MLDSTHDANEKLFRGDQHFTTMRSNSKKLIAKHQHGGVLTAARGKINKMKTGSGADGLGLGR